MKRDMELIRKILLEIEKQYISTSLFNLTIEGYDMATIAYHCKIMHEANLISAYNAQYADDDIYFFAVGPLTWEGNDYLDKVRDNSIWHKTKTAIREKGLPLIVDTIKVIATAYINASAEGLVNSIMQGGQL